MDPKIPSLSSRLLISTILFSTSQLPFLPSSTTVIAVPANDSHQLGKPQQKASYRGSGLSNAPQLIVPVTKTMKSAAKMRSCDIQQCDITRQIIQRDQVSWV